MLRAPAGLTSSPVAALPGALPTAAAAEDQAGGVGGRPSAPRLTLRSSRRSTPLSQGGKGGILAVPSSDLSSPFPVPAVSAVSSPLTPSAPSPTPTPIAEGKKVERRVLPARIRRAAGGAEGIRELEEMVVDWLERYADCSGGPPKSLQITLCTLPRSLVTPAPFVVEVKKPTEEADEDVETEVPVPVPVPEAGPSRSRIETPSWVFVRPGEDDAEEAREEIAAARARVPHSPTKRLRGGVVGHDLGEDTSDAYYEKQHRKFEVFERRQRIREREKLSFERYKMRSRVDLLRALPAAQWTSVVGGILSRSDMGAWARGRAKLAAEGFDWLRRRLIREGKELLSRYDELLPAPAASETKKPRFSLDASPMPESVSPPPSAPSRREQNQSQPAKRGRGVRGPSRLHSVNPETSPRRRHSPASTSAAAASTSPSHPRGGLDFDSDSSLSDPPSPTPPPSPPRTKIILRFPRPSSLTPVVRPASAPAAAGRKPPKDRSSSTPTPKIRLRASGLIQTKLSVTSAPPGPQPAAHSAPPPTAGPASAAPVPAPLPSWLPPPQPIAVPTIPNTSPIRADVGPSHGTVPTPSNVVPLWWKSTQPALPATPSHSHPHPHPHHPHSPPQRRASFPTRSPLSPRAPLHAPGPSPGHRSAPVPPPVVHKWWTPQRPHASLPATHPPPVPQTAPPTSRPPPHATSPSAEPPDSRIPRKRGVPQQRFTFPSQSHKSLLMEAAAKRERDDDTNVSPSDNGKRRRHSSNRGSRPFGMPMPPSVEQESEFGLPDDEYRPILDQRERDSASPVKVPVPRRSPPTSDEMDIEGVEQAVVL